MANSEGKGESCSVSRTTLSKSVFGLALVVCLLLSVMAVLRERKGLQEHYQEAGEGRALKVATWNLEWFPGKSQKPTPEEEVRHFHDVLEALKELDADILCLQEIRDPMALTDLAEAAGLELQTISNFEGVQEVAVLSREPAIASFAQRFEKREINSPPRGFAYAHFRLEGLPDLHVYSVHLKSNYGGIEETTAKREEAARQLVDHADAVIGDDGVAIVTGDFNTDPTRDDWDNDRTLGILGEAGFEWTGSDVPREELISWLSNGRYPDAVFDHILVRGDLVWGEAKAGKTSREVSDHRAVSVSVSLR